MEHILLWLFVSSVSEYELHVKASVGDVLCDNSTFKAVAKIVTDEWAQSLPGLLLNLLGWNGMDSFNALTEIVSVSIEIFTNSTTLAWKN